MSSRISDHDASTEGSPSMWVGFAIGWVIIAFGFWTLLQNGGQNNPKYSLALALGFNVVHDAVVAPIACSVGYLLSRLAPRRVRAQIAWGLFSSAVVVGIAYAPLRGLGRKSDNPTVQPLNYASAVATVLATVWLIVLLLIVLTEVRRRRHIHRSTET